VKPRLDASDPLTTRSPVIILVDDHQDTLAMYALALLVHGFQPVTISDADTAFHRACELRPAAVVTDLGIGGSSGIDPTRWIRGDGRTREIPVILLTGYTAPAVLRAAHTAGCDRVLMKPCSPDALAREIRRVIDAPVH
jgi:CheY-like chemotaxis protein